MEAYKRAKEKAIEALSRSDFSSNPSKE